VQENGDIEADGKSKRSDGSGRKHRPLQQLSNAVPQFSEDRIHRMT
jgi:hypothetical protein